MKRTMSILTHVGVGILLLANGDTEAQETGSIVGWGSMVVVEPSGLENLTAVAGVFCHSLGLKADGSVVAWGYNQDGRCAVPTPNADFVAVAGGYDHSLGLKADGSVVGWGWNAFGRCTIPALNADFVAVAGGWDHSLGLKADGSVVAWGRNDDGQCTVPAPNADFVAVASGIRHSLSLKVDSSVVTWGDNVYGQCTVPIPNADFVAVAASGLHSLGLRSVTSAAEDHGPGEVPGTVTLEILSVAPNPFNPSTEVVFETRVSGHVSMEIYDVNGRCVRAMPLGRLGSGRHWTRWDGRDGHVVDLASGVYFVCLRGEERVAHSVKAVLIR